MIFWRFRLMCGVFYHDFKAYPLTPLCVAPPPDKLACKYIQTHGHKRTCNTNRGVGRHFVNNFFDNFLKYWDHGTTNFMIGTNLEKSLYKMLSKRRSKGFWTASYAAENYLRKTSKRPKKFCFITGLKKSQLRVGKALGR